MRNFSHLLNEIETPEDEIAVLKILDYLKEHKDENITIRIVNKQTENLYEEVYSLTEDEHNHTKVIFFDKNGDFLKTNNVQVTDTLNHEEVINKSGKIVYNANVNPESGKLPILSSQKEVFDTEGNLVYVEKYEQSTDVPNKYNMYREYPDGRVEQIGSAYIASNGDTVIKKNLVSDNGVQTEYVYVESPNGTKFNYTKITDSEGNILLENKYRYKVIDENNFITTENGVEYKIEYTDDEVTVTNNNTGETVTITIGENKDDTSVLSKDLLPLLKEMPGSFYFAIDKYGLEKVGLNIDDVEDNNAHYSGENNLIALSDEVENESFTFAHEFGHYLDKHLDIRNNPEIISALSLPVKVMSNAFAKPSPK